MSSPFHRRKWTRGAKVTGMLNSNNLLGPLTLVFLYGVLHSLGWHYLTHMDFSTINPKMLFSMVTRPYNFFILEQ